MRRAAPKNARRRSPQSARTREEEEGERQQRSMLPACGRDVAHGQECAFPLLRRSRSGASGSLGLGSGRMRIWASQNVPSLEHGRGAHMRAAPGNVRGAPAPEPAPQLSPRGEDPVAPCDGRRPGTRRYRIRAPDLVNHTQPCESRCPYEKEQNDTRRAREPRLHDIRFNTEIGPFQPETRAMTMPTRRATPAAQLAGGRPPAARPPEVDQSPCAGGSCDDGVMASSTFVSRSPTVAATSRSRRRRDPSRSAQSKESYARPSTIT
jgi:hypothetical protein